MKATLITQAKEAKDASLVLANTCKDLRNKAIIQIAVELENNLQCVLAANKADMEQAIKKGLPASKLDRLMLNKERVLSIASSVRDISNLGDPLATSSNISTRPNGMRIEKRKVPLGVVGMIYEARPNVTVDASALCLKSGNTVLLRGGAQAHNSNIELVRIMKLALEKVGLPQSCIQLVQDASRETAIQMMKLDKYLDVLIPRGGANLIRTIKENATVPIIETGTGNCHIYVDRFADLDMAQNILINAKVQRPSVCNSCESLLIHEKVAKEFLTLIQTKLEKCNVQTRGCDKTLKLIKGKKATTDDYFTEYNDLVLSVKVVKDIDHAITHINTHGTKHSECIVTNCGTSAKKFLKMIDCACVYHNVSTRFSDGFEFGFGAEIGISTQKLHARGPFALNELTTYKYVVTGNGQTRR